MSWARCLTGMTSTPSTSAASRASGSGTNTVRQPSCRATTTMGSMAFVWRTLPSSESSPRNTEESGSSRSWPELTRTDTAIGRSYAGPAFLRSAGARLTVIRRIGNSHPEFLMAARTRSRASCTAASGRPTIVKAGSPGEISTSTSTITPSRPTIAHVLLLASMGKPRRAYTYNDARRR